MQNFMDVLFISYHTSKSIKDFKKMIPERLIYNIQLTGYREGKPSGNHMGHRCIVSLYVQSRMWNRMMDVNSLLKFVNRKTFVFILACPIIGKVLVGKTKTSKGMKIANDETCQKNL